MNNTAPYINPEPKAVLCKALFNVQDQLGLTQAELGTAIGMDRSTVSRLKSRGILDPSTKEGELAACLVRLFRALYVLVGGDQATMRHWLRDANRHLNGRPIELIGRIQGLVRVIEYLDAMRGKV
jgi:uncharacterized protein (DUF2384 family)